MKKWTLGYNYPVALTISLTCSLWPMIPHAGPLNQPAAIGFLDSLCYDYVPKIERATAENGGDEQMIHVDADRLEAEQGGTAIYKGDVQVRQGLRKFDSDYAQLDQKSRDVIAIGNIHYSDGQVTVTSDKTLKSNLNTKESVLEEGRYQVHGSPVRGFAQRVTLSDDQQRITMKQAHYTTCPPGQELWTLRAGTINIDQQNVFGEAWNASLWLHNVPIFYFPYMTFPIKDERKTGLLYPSYKQSSGNGMEIIQPFYWNIAPNYDATITSRFMDRRGLMNQLEFRYMPDPAHRGIIYIENLSDDKQFDKGNPRLANFKDGHRYLVNLRHDSMFADNALRVNVNYTRVRDNDNNYFNDFSPPVGTLVDSQLQQSVMAGYYQPNWNLTAEMRRYQILLSGALLPHEMLPQISYNYYQQGSWYDLAWNSELTHFGYDSGTSSTLGGERYTATRLHLEPTLTMPLIDAPGYYFTSQYKMMVTAYDQSLPQTLTYADRRSFTDPVTGKLTLAEGSIYRTLPSFRLMAGSNFDRTINWQGGKWIHTLEPAVQYLYIPYRNQNNIGLYDTTTTRQDFYSLFSDRYFAGLDRISDANRITLGLTSRLYDNSGDERLRLAVAQAFEVTTPKVQLDVTNQRRANTRSKLSFVGDGRFSDNWFAYLGAEYDTAESQFTASSSALEYRQDRFITQFNYRFIKDGNLDYRKRGKETDLSQAGVVLMAPVRDNWLVYGGYYRDVKQDININRKIGIKYDSCCWSLNLGFEWYRQADNVVFEPRSERIVGLQFEMKGLGSVGTAGRQVNLDTHLLPYIRPFNLKDQ